MKEKYAHLALLAVGALLVLYWLYTRSQTAAAGAVGDGGGGQPDNSSAAPAYPNAAPIQMGDITIGGSPTELIYNQQPVTEGADGIYDNPNLLATSAIVTPDSGCGCDDPCAIPAGQITTVNNIPAPVFNAAVKNLDTLNQKMSVTQSASSLPVSDNINAEGGSLNL